MLIIRDEQMERFRQEQVQRFLREMEEHARRFFPAACVDLGEEGTRVAVNEAVEQARAHGFNSARDACKFLNLSFGLGRNFYAEPWIEEILCGEEDNAFKVMRIREAAAERKEATNA